MTPGLRPPTSKGDGALPGLHDRRGIGRFAIIGWRAQNFGARQAIVGAGVIVMLCSTALPAHLARTGGMSRAGLVDRAYTLLPSGPRRP
ncbi:MAG: hypothetical protein JWN20_548 [Jatrophihabitantaceae bacterium]|nr:hypothetical protein [Jatrophihabitantaceae bacterium]